jgi:dTDP-4-dehydrorhamnose 3,5-epimerase-like enzyme
MSSSTTGLQRRAGDLDAVRWIDFPSHRDERGTLTAVESARDIPFEIKRVYFVHDVVTERGGHAHLETQQVVTVVSGRCDLYLHDGTRERHFVLDDVRRGLYIGPMLFIRTANFAPGTVLISLANSHYDKAKSLRSWADFQAAIAP